MKRAAVLMALDAAGVSIDQVQRDAKARQGALDAYEAEQKKLAEADWTRKAEEIVQIQAEMESIKAHYMARIKRNQEAVARDKARFSNWVATKQQEAQSMTEALDLCLKSQPSPPSEPVSSPPSAEFSMAASAGLAAAPISGKPQ
jgi:predicted transcriptional regulator